jgi:hypothetical protein
MVLVSGEGDVILRMEHSAPEHAMLPTRTLILSFCVLGGTLRTNKRMTPLAAVVRLVLPSTNADAGSITAMTGGMK